MSGTYHETRFTEDPRRDVLWRTLWQHVFRYHIGADHCVLDLGSGYGNFINQVEARRRIAVDVWPEFVAHLAPGVEGIVSDVTKLDFVPDASVDFAFASNLFEHLTQYDFAQTLEELKRILSSRGSLNILQPNYRYAYREYFDDYTHIAIYSHVSISDFLRSQGWEVFESHPRFLPLTIKSSLPVHPWLIRAYLMLPIRPFGKQMLIRARPRR